MKQLTVMVFVLSISCACSLAILGDTENISLRQHARRLPQSRTNEQQLRHVCCSRLCDSIQSEIHNVRSDVRTVAIFATILLVECCIHCNEHSISNFLQAVDPFIFRFFLYANLYLSHCLPSKLYLPDHCKTINTGSQ